MNHDKLTDLKGEWSNKSTLPSLPSTWCWVPLGEVVQNFDGRRIPVKQSDRDNRTGPYPYYGASGIIDDIDDFLFDGDYLLIAEDGANLLSRSTPIAFQASGRFWVNNHAHIVQMLGDLPLGYLKWYLNGANLQFFITGTAQPKLNQVNLNRIPVPVAPTGEQRRIVAKIEELFSDLDAGVAALERAKANLKRYRAAVLKAAVEGKLTEQWRADHPDAESASQLLQRILTERRQKWEADQLAKFAAANKTPPKNWRDKYPEPSHEEGLYQLPSTWTWASTSEICERVENGNTPPPDEMAQGIGEVPFIKVYNLTKSGTLDFTINPTFVSKRIHEGLLGRSRILPNDVLMNIVGPPLGKVSVVPDQFPEWNTNQAVVLFRSSRGVLPRYLAACLLCDEVLTWIIRTARATAGQSNLSVGNSRLLPVPIPPIAEQHALLESLDEKLTQIDFSEAAITQSLARANRLRQSILKQAFEGKLVPQDPRDEPASVLLERLRVADRKAADGHLAGSGGSRKNATGKNST